jgi:hypothetical protein
MGVLTDIAADFAGIRCFFAVIREEHVHTGWLVTGSTTSHFLANWKFP